MNTGNETQGKSGLEGFSSMIAQCCGGAQEGKGQKYDFTICKQMMKSFCADKDGKMDFDACRAKMASIFRENGRMSCCAKDNPLKKD